MKSQASSQVFWLNTTSGYENNPMPAAKCSIILSPSRPRRKILSQDARVCLVLMVSIVQYMRRYIEMTFQWFGRPFQRTSFHMIMIKLRTAERNTFPDGRALICEVRRVRSELPPDMLWSEIDTEMDRLERCASISRAMSKIQHQAERAHIDHPHTVRCSPLGWTRVNLFWRSVDCEFWSEISNYFFDWFFNSSISNTSHCRTSRCC
jgi:hypothetical protein